VIVCFVDIGGIVGPSPLNCDGQQFHQNQQNKQSPLNSDGPTIPPMSTKQTITSKQ
jgi:hypothetical protein